MPTPRKSGYAYSMASFRTISSVDSSSSHNPFCNWKKNVDHIRLIHLEKRNIVTTKTQQVCVINFSSLFAKNGQLNLVLLRLLLVLVLESKALYL